MGTKWDQLLCIIMDVFDSLNTNIHTYLQISSQVKKNQLEFLLTDSLMQNSIFKYSLEMVCFTNKSFNGRLFLDFIVKLMEVGNDKC